MQAEAEYRALKVQELKRELLPKSELAGALANAFMNIRQTILGSPLPHDIQDSVLKHLAECNIPE
jgi:hypothetical protein